MTRGMEFESHTFSYQKSEVSYLAGGKGRPLVVLHGWGSSSRVMIPASTHLSDLRRCYLIDFPGFGASPEPPRAWSIDDYADVVEAFIDSLGEEKVDLFVHSFGGRVALKLLAREKTGTRIGRILITGGAGMKPRRSFGFYVRKYLAKLLKAPFLLLPGRLRERSLAWLRETALWKRLGSSDYRQLTGVMRETFVRSVSEYLDPLLQQIDHEILLLWGENDEATPLYQAERMEKGLKNSALVVIEKAGHYAFLDRPKRFASIARAFFSAS